MIIGHQDIISFYEYFYSHKYGNSSYKFKPTEKAVEVIEKFLHYLDLKYKLVCLGKDFLTRYYTFQFKRVEGQVFKRFSSKDKAGKVQIYDIVGKKAIEYWENRDVKFDFTINMPINIDRKIDYLSISISEEIEKKRFYNTDRGILNCLEKTSLFDHKSVICVLCSFKNNCKKLLEQNYHNIYIDRGYGSTTA